jgi:hypothetical protein
MVSAILGQVSGQLEKRFILNAFFPTLVFGLALGAAVAAGAGGISAAVDLWEGQDSLTKVLLVIGAVSLVLVGANLLSNGMQRVIELFEGYVGVPKWLADWARAHQLRRAAKLQAKVDGGDEVAADAFQRSFPVYPRELRREHVAPTRLGNVLRSAETYPKDRYGVDSVRIWPRLYHLLPEAMTDAINEARSSMEFLLGIAFLAALYALLASAYLIASSAGLLWIAFALVVPSLISALAYLGSLAPAGVYGEHIRAAFDLHRHHFLKAAGVPVPMTLAEEKRAWEMLTPLLERGREFKDWRYVWPAS